jgi:hypothetical protein
MASVPAADALVRADQATLWHPASHFDDVALLPPIAIRGARGPWLERADGGRILDAIASWWTSVHGHCEPSVVEAIASQARTLDHVMFAGFTHEPAVALARALVTNPRVLLLDEPLSALDEYLRLRMRGELTRVQKELGITFVHVTHTQLEAIAVADLVVVMEHGRIEQAGSPREIYAAPRSVYVARFVGGQNVLSGAVDGAATGEGATVVRGRSRWRVPLGGSTAQPGSVVHAALRRDRIALAKVAAGANLHAEENTLVGEVHAIEYQGSHVKVTIDMEDSEEFVANVADEAFLADPLEIGDRVRARWTVGDVRRLEGGAAGAGTGDRLYASS